MCFQILAWHPRTYVKEFMDMLPAMLNKDTVIEVLHCVQFFISTMTTLRAVVSPGWTLR